MLTSLEVLYMVAWAVMEWKDVPLPTLEIPRNVPCRVQHKPPNNFVTLNVDAIFLPSPCKQEQVL